MFEPEIYEKALEGIADFIGHYVVEHDGDVPTALLLAYRIIWSHYCDLYSEV